MDLKEKLVSSFLAFQNNVDIDHPVHDIRSEAIKNFETNGFPNRKQEAWKYTSLNSLQKVDFSIFPKKVNALEYRDVKHYFLHEMDTYKIVFIDGVYSSYLSETTHEGVDVCLLSAALTKPMYQPLIELYFNKVASKEDSLTSLNTAFSKEVPIFTSPRIKRRLSPLKLSTFPPGTKRH